MTFAPVAGTRLLARLRAACRARIGGMREGQGGKVGRWMLRVGHAQKVALLRLGGEPVHAFEKSITGCGTAELNMPPPLRVSVEAELVDYFGSANRIRTVLY